MKQKVRDRDSLSIFQKQKVTTNVRKVLEKAKSDSNTMVPANQWSMWVFLISHARCTEWLCYSVANFEKLECPGAYPHVNESTLTILN